MCAHYVGLTPEEIERLVEALDEPPEARADAVRDVPLGAPSVDVYPRTPVTLVVPTVDAARPGAFAPFEARWGFTRPWTPDPIFNTRIESADKPMWRDPLAHGRCLIACRWFYESHRGETVPSARTGRPVARQYAFRVPGAPVMLIGGVRAGREFSMVTTAANRDMAPVHARMPLVVRPGEVGTWLGPDWRMLADRADVALESRPVR